MSTPSICLPESATPPEGPSVLEWDTALHEADQALSWDPHAIAKLQLGTEDAILLERRSITRHPALPPHGQGVRPRQLEIWRSATAQKNSIAAKLRSCNQDALAHKLENCHTYYTVALCGTCGLTRKFPNRCNLFCCPECAAALARNRCQQIEWWTELIHQPKHLVLTVKNVRNLERGHIVELREAFTRLRHHKFARNWRGGFYSIQITKRKHGWHPHIHCLVDAPFIDKAALEQAWARASRQSGKIVHIRDARQGDYLREVTRYAVGGSQLAKWTAPDICAFISAFVNLRTFGVFGTLYGARTHFKEFIASVRESRRRCPCGSSDVRYYDEAAFIALDLQPTPDKRPEPPLPPSRQNQLDVRDFRWPD